MTDSAKQYRVVDTDNFNGDQPFEKFVGPPMSARDAQKVADAINAGRSECYSRWHKVVELPYALAPAFTP